MNMPNPIRDPEYFAQMFSQCVRAVVHILIWGTVGLVCLAAAYIAIRTTLVAVNMVLKSLGV